MKAAVILVAAAMAAFGVMFSPWTQQHIPFWPMMTVTAGLLAGVSLILQRNQLSELLSFRVSHLWIGLVAAGLLYGVFWVGHFVSTHLLPFAASQVESIYAIRAEQNPWMISGLMLLIIGPAEEIFWRGFVQKRFAAKLGLFTGFAIAAALYAFVHVGSFNFMLIAAAALCGIFWGLLFTATDNLWPCIISHAVWDVMIFILLPIQ